MSQFVIKAVAYIDISKRWNCQWVSQSRLAIPCSGRECAVWTARCAGHRTQNPHEAGPTICLYKSVWQYRAARHPVPAYLTVRSQMQQLRLHCRDILQTTGMRQPNVSFTTTPNPHCTVATKGATSFASVFCISALPNGNRKTFCCPFHSSTNTGQHLKSNPAHVKEIK